jgi:hypothetical protein
MKKPIPCDERGCPDLQRLVDQRGREYAASIPQVYDPADNPHHGGYQHISVEDWAEFDRLTAEWRARYARRS